ncbi:MAG TPA: dihydrolipoamide acetyltransferase family protein [Baekduia sp.]|uniref:dihydrolipoamide acetyltransferase family protein n=1 Tax=Baekduia sp. TaxID=2600305 RepID=UPI002D77315A|nr:dihydrolipoamide acetyltransferase family protein [Baekduia sp.]HET6507985.1 dihydrolipoamide acetyltransferase family protein [Baekduia sp.]
MPRLSDSMEEGVIVRWLKADGDEVARNEPVVEIETDKATMEFEASDAGVLSIVVPEGSTVPVGAVIAHVGERGAAEPVAAAAATAVPASAAVAAAVAAAPAAAPPAPAVGNGHEKGNAGPASPLARRLAEALGIDIATVVGTGRNGRILKADVRTASERPAPEPVAAPAASPAADATGARGAVEAVALSRIQTTVARRMAEAKATIPDFWTSLDVDMAAVLELRTRLKASMERPPSINDIIVAATARALRRHPRVNGSYRDGAFELWERVNVGVAVATDDGLVVPTLFDADRATLGTIAAETRRLAEKVRAGTVTPPELAGGTFTVSNLGMFGASAFGGIVNAPQAGILCVGAVSDRPWAVDGAVVVRPVATLTLVADHRILYGADSAKFLATVGELLADPLTILV